MPPVRLLSDKSSEVRDLKRETSAGIAPARWFLLRLRLVRAGNMAKSKVAAIVPATIPALGMVSSATWPIELHLMPDQEQQVEEGDHDASGEEPLASENSNVDFHLRSASASASNRGETALHANICSRKRRRQVLFIATLYSMIPAAIWGFMWASGRLASLFCTPSFL